MGGIGYDTASYTLFASGVIASLVTGKGFERSAGEADTDFFISIENLRGSDFDDGLTGDGGANRLDGRAGNDFIFGGGGDTAGDTFMAVEGFFGTGFAYALRGDGGENTLGGGGGFDVLGGRDGNDRLFGGDGADSISGVPDFDYIEGEGGADKLAGGAGLDQFVYALAADSGPGSAARNQINDFTQGDDHIALDLMDAKSAGTATTPSSTSTSTPATRSPKPSARASTR